MPSVDEVYPTGTIKGADLKGKDVKVKISEVGRRTFDDGEKLVLHFHLTDKTMPLNKTNASAIAAIHGDDYTRWVGRGITLYPTEVDFRGTPTLTVRVRPQDAAPPTPPTETGYRAAEEPARAGVGDHASGDGDDIPF